MREAWSKERIIEEIKTLNNNNVSLKSISIRKSNAKLFSASRRYFGGWKQAVRESGIDYTGFVPNEIKIVGDTKEITVTKLDGTKVVVIVDADTLITRVSVNKSGYPTMLINNKSVYLHRYVYGDIGPQSQVDHISRNPLDCRMSNLREVTYSQNGQNTRANGYYFHNRRKRWVARITTNRKRKHLGNFKTEKEASIAYLKAKLKYHNEYAPIDTKLKLNKLLEEE